MCRTAAAAQVPHRQRALNDRPGTLREELCRAHFGLVLRGPSRRRGPQTALLRPAASKQSGPPIRSPRAVCARLCVVELAEGSVRDLRNGEQKNAGDRIQTCVSTAAGDCTLRY